MDEEVEVRDVKKGEIIPFWSRFRETETAQLIDVAHLVEPDEVIGYRRRRKYRLSTWLILPLKIIVACAVAFVLFCLPDFQLNLLVTWKNPVVVLLTVCYIGKSLIDTLFYDHYLP